MFVLKSITLILALVVDGIMISLKAVISAVVLALTSIFMGIVLFVRLLPLAPWGLTILGGYLLWVSFDPMWVITGGIGVAVPVVFGSMLSHELFDAMVQILKGLYIRPLNTFSRQEPNPDNGYDTGFITFIATREEYFTVRRAANLAGIWFSHVKWEPLAMKYVYKVWFVEKD
jgi:hypothetical protein